MENLENIHGNALTNAKFFSIFTALDLSRRYNIMPLTAQQVEKLLLGKYTFEHLNFSMMLMRMKMLYARDPSYSSLQNCTKEICDFLDKFKAHMSTDYAILARL